MQIPFLIGNGFLGALGIARTRLVAMVVKMEMRISDFIMSVIAANALSYEGRCA